MKNILTILFILIVSVSQATGYYVSFSDGSDSDSGLTEALAWKTEANINAGTFSPGDTIKFKCGDVWSKHFVFPSSGSIGNPIVITSYGIGSKPVFTSPILLANWTSIGGGIYTTSPGIGSIYTYVWEDGKSIDIASSSALTDGDWYYTGGTSYYKPSTGTPSNHILNYSRLYGAMGGYYNYTPAIDISDRSYITVTGLRFNYCGIGITTWDTSGTNTIEVKNCEFYDCHDGVMMQSNTGHNTNTLIHDNYFKYCMNAIRMYINPNYQLSELRNCKIYRNEMYAVGTIDGTTRWDVSYGTDYESIGLQNIQNCEIYDNYIHEGYNIGINTWNTANMFSRNNLYYRNYIENIPDTPIAFDSNPNSIGYSGNWVYNNILINTGISAGFSFTQGLSEAGMNYFVNNTCIGDWAGFKLYTTYSTAIYLTIQNNIFYGTGNYYSRINGIPTNLVINYNMYKTKTGGSPYFYIDNTSLTFAQFQIIGYEINGTVNDPLFVSTSNFNLQSSSPAINVGTNTGITTDYIRHSRVLPIDIGAYEYSQSINPTNKKIILRNGVRYYVNPENGKIRVK